IPDPPIDPSVVGVPADAYRTTLRLTVDRAGRPVFHRRHSHQHVHIDSCLVAHPALAELATTARFPGGREVTLRVSAATGERTATLHPPRGRAHVPDDVRVAGR